MSSKPFPKGFLLSSTPVQSPEDSGYFGSGERKKNYGLKSNVLNTTCSPIKELAFKNLSESFPLEHDFDEISQFNNKILDNENCSKDLWEINEVSELKFTNDKLFSQNDICRTLPLHKSSEQRCLSPLYNFSDDTKNESYSLNSLSESEDIHYKLFDYMPINLVDRHYLKDFKSLNNDLQGLTASKQTKIDFIHQLKEINCFSILSCILSYLSAKELCAASCVSKEWNEIIQGDHNADFRREKFIREKYLLFNGPSKENRLGMKVGPTGEPKKAFSDLTNICNIVHHLNSMDSSTRFDSFIKEAKNGHSNLLKCPKCHYASKCLNGHNYTCTHCSYTFCSYCLDPTFKNHTCSKPQLPNIIVGSKKSKKNLKRL